MVKRSRLLRWTLAVAAILIAAGIAVPFLVRVASFIPEIALLASGSLGQPVTISNLTAHLLPTPRLVVEGVRIGKKGEVVIGELEIVPELRSLFSSTRTVRLIRAERVELKEAALSIPDKMPKGGDPVEVRRLVLREVRLQHSALKLPLMNFDVDLGIAMQVEKARFSTSDGALKVFLDADGTGRTLVKLEASGWRLPLAAAPLVFNSLKAKGAVTVKRLEISTIEGRLYGGTLRGNARADWRKLWQVSGTTVLAGIDLAGAQRALGRDARLSGRLDANAKFTATAKSLDQLVGALGVDGPFNVADGIYRGVDLAKVGDLTGGKSVGGATRFDELRGIVQLRGKQVRVNELCAKSSVLQAAGFVEVAPNQTLTGRLGVSLARTGGVLGVPVALSGTVQDPVVRPTRGYTIGAVVGTVLLPGVGTALGASAGGAIEGKAANCK